MTGLGRAQVRVAVVGPQDWALWRELRLEALLDTPIGFGERYSDAVRRTQEQWRAAVLRPGRYLAAHDGQGPVGIAGGFLDPQDRPTLFAVFVRPRARGLGVLDALVDDLARWAAPAPLRLEVHEDNVPAASAYVRLGFVATGQRRPYPLDPTRSLLEMNRP